MKRLTTLRWLTLLSLLLASIAARAATTSEAYAYEVLAFRDSKNNFDGWTSEVDGKIYSYSTRLPKTSDGKSGVLCWAFASAGYLDTSSKFPFQIPETIMVRKDSQTDWTPVTVDSKTGFTGIPAGYDYVKVSVKNNCPAAITIGPQVDASEEVQLSSFDAPVALIGETTERGIKAIGNSVQTVEVSIPCATASHLSQAFSKINYCFISAVDPESDHYDYYHGNFTATVTAVTTRGDEVEMPQFMELSMMGGSMSFTRYCLLPTNTMEIKIKWTFTDIPFHLEPSEDGEIEVYSPVYVRADEDIYSPSQSNFLQQISQRAGATTSSAASGNIFAPRDPALWYDVDGDGIKEFVGTSKSVGTNATPQGLCKLNADLRGFYSLNPSFPTGITGWVKYDKGDGIGAYANDAIYSVNGLEATQVASTEHYPLLLDYNNDGTTDFWIDSYIHSSVPDKVLTAGPDGSLIEDRLVTLTPEEYYNYVKQHVSSSGLGSGVSFVGDSGMKTTPHGSFYSYSMVDINGDGYLDFINGDTGRYLMNTGDGRYMIDTFGGTVLFRDFDGDGLSDLLVYDSDEKSITVNLQRRGEDTVSRKLFSGLSCGSNIWCRDFDRDGDVDILVPFNASDNSGQAYLVMFENTGKGNFKKRENYIDGDVDFYFCTDWNADGKLEVLAQSFSDCTRKVFSYTVDGIKVNTSPVQIYEGPDGSFQAWKDEYKPMIIADIDNTGIQRMIVFNDLVTPDGTGANSRPGKPEAPKVIYTPSTGEVVVTWELGSDKETAPLDLTYELRIGTAPGLGDIVWADALADGTRRNLSQGNCGYALQRRFYASSWPSGKIYVSIQAVDDGCMGSTFSEPAVFEKKLPAASFVISTPDAVTVGDECAITLQNAPGSDTSVEWSLDGATIVAETSSSLTVKYATPGEKQLTLRITDAQGNTATSAQTLKVIPAKLTVTSYAEGGLPESDVRAALDMDLDGKVELVSGYDRANTPFYEGDDNGVYTPVKRLFNANAAITGRPKVVDVNRDGLPDVVTEGYQSITHFINEDDKSMQISQYSPGYTYYVLPVVDLDNDGIMDMTRYRNNGDYVSYSPVDMSFLSGEDYYVDFNGDGLVDILSVSAPSIIFYANKGNFRFEEERRITIDDMTSYNNRGCCIGDFDGDGKVDYVWNDGGGGHGISWTSEYTYVCWNDGTVTKIPAPSGCEFSTAYNVFDYDNNGCQDLMTNCGIIFFNSDRSYELVRTEGYNSDMVYRRTDGRIGIDHAILSCKANTAPTAPAGLRASQNSDAVVIEWNRAGDAETPAVALRYNISVKHADAEGEGAYFISPLNGGVNGVAVPTGTILHNSTKLTIPVGVIPAGDYEVKVQAVDNQWLQGDFSETLRFSVIASAAVDMPTATMVNSAVPVRINAGFTLEDIDFGADAVVESVEGNIANVHWTSEGLKTVKAGGFIAQIFVNPALDASFNLPAQIYVGDKVCLACDNTHPDLWEISTGILEQHIYFSPVNREWNRKAVSFTVIDDNASEIVFNSSNNWNLRHTVTEDYGTDTYRSSTAVSRHPAEPALSLVRIDDATGKHKLSWSVPDHLQSLATAVNIYKETARNGEYRLLATLPLTESDYVDSESVPEIVASRYALSYALSYGETAMSAPHQPIHVMINKGIGNSWNLSWGKYEGRDITTYRILRGTSPTMLDYVTEVSGNVTSYTDFNAPAGDCYYAIEILVDDTAVGSRAGSSALASRSNVVSTADAGSVVFVSSIEIASETGSCHIDAKETETLQLLAYINPINASLTRLDWVVKEGSDVVTVSQSGLVTAIGNGSAVIAAYATDGSGIYGEVTVSVSDFSGIESIGSDNRVGELTIVDFGSEIEVSGIVADEMHLATLSIYNLNGVVLDTVKTTASRERINVSSLPAGLYILSSRAATSAPQSVRFIKR